MKRAGYSPSVILDVGVLPAAVRPLMNLCLELSPSSLQHQSTVFEYLLAGESALATELIIAGAERELRPAERALIANRMKDVYLDVWAVPGAAEAWVNERCSSPPKT